MLSVSSPLYPSPQEAGVAPNIGSQTLTQPSRSLYRAVSFSGVARIGSRMLFPIGAKSDVTFYQYAKRHSFFECFPYVSPEPVLVK